MADDQKLEVLEEEIKVLKGEVRRTLVDLRALVMRADSPLNESGVGRRGAMADLAPEEEAPVLRKESAELVRREITEPIISVPPPPPPPPPPVPEAAANPGPGAGFTPPGPPAGMPPGMPPQAPPQWPVSQPPPPPPPMPTPGPPPGAPDSGAA